MRWILLGLIAAFVFWGCDEDESTSADIVLVEAPARLPFVGSYWDPQAFETLSVRFMVKLEPPLSGVDSVICRVYDQNDSKIDSFELFDDGGQFERHEGSICQLPYSGDHEAGNGTYTREIKSWEFAPNISGSQFTFRFSASHPHALIREATHVAYTWAPWISISDIVVAPVELPLCEDEFVIEAKLFCDSLDSLTSVIFGNAPYSDYIQHPLAVCTRISGDTIWRGVVSRDNWRGFTSDELMLQAHSSKGVKKSVFLNQLFTFRSTTVDAGVTPDTFQLSALGVNDTFLIKCALEMCPEYSNEPIGSDFIPEPDSDTLDLRSIGNMNDCGINGDESPNDGIHTGRLVIFSPNLNAPHSLEVDFVAGIADYTDSCHYYGSYYYLSHSTVTTKTITLLPPQ